MALTLSKEALKESLTADKAGAALTKIQDARVFKQMGTLLMIAGAVALGLFVFFWSQKPAYTPLYTGLDAKATAEATDMLRAAQIPFQLDQATGAISVPEANLHDARLKLAGAGLAESGRLQKGKRVALMRRGHIAAAAHFRESHAKTGLGELPCGFGSGEAAADDVNVVTHFTLSVDLYVWSRARWLTCAAVAAH